MYRNLRLRTAAALAAIVCLLFAQLAAAAYSCPAPLHSVAVETALDAAGQGGSGTDPCTGHEAARPGLCVAHCNPTELSLNHPQADSPPPLLIALHPMADQFEPAVPAPTAPRFVVPLRSHSPPFSVLHCCFRI